MISLNRMSAGSGFRYLLRHTASADVDRQAGTSLTEYYTASGNPPGRWLGAGLGGLGGGAGLPTGMQVSEQAMAAVFGAATDPFTGVPLGRPFPTRCASDGSTRPGGVAGFDLTFTVPKSVSVLWGLGDPAVQRAVLAAHHATVERVLALIEERALPTRTGHAGAVQMATRDHVDDALLAEFSTRSSQITGELDNMLTTFAAEHGREPTRLENKQLRQTATLATRPAKTVRHLSELRDKWATQARVATSHSPADLLDAALTPRSPLPGWSPLGGHLPPQVMSAVIDLTLAGVRERRSTWTTWNLVAEASRALKPVRFTTAEDRIAAVDAVVAEALSRCVPLHNPATLDPLAARTARWTDSVILDAETRLLTATHDTGAPTATAPSQQLNHVQRDKKTSPRESSATGLSSDQAAAVHAIASSGRRVEVLVGPAGSGKTTTLRTLAETWHAAHGPGSVIGLAPSSNAAAQLATSLGVECENTAKWLHESSGPGAQQQAQPLARLGQRLANTLASGRPSPDLAHARSAIRGEKALWQLTSGQLLIVDEASLAGTLTLDTLASQATAAGAKLLLVGDHHQLCAVEAGGAFGLLARRTRAVELADLWRFTHRWEADATRLLREGDPTAIDVYDAHERLHDGPADAMLDAVYQAWQGDIEDGRSSLLIAADNETVTLLNTRARADRVNAGASAPDGVELVDGTTAGVGDSVITRLNARRIVDRTGQAVSNGDQWTVTQVSRRGDLLLTRADQDAAAMGRPPDAGDPRLGQVILPSAYVAEYLDLGYAVTVHRAQGRTVDTAHVIAADGMSREHLYVAMSRGRHANHAYVPTDQVEQTGQTRRDVLGQVLATSSAELSATEHLEALITAEPDWSDIHSNRIARLNEDFVVPRTQVTQPAVVGGPTLGI